MVFGVNRLPTCESSLRPSSLPLTANRRRWSSVHKIRFLPSFSLSTAFSVRRYSMTSRCCRLIQPARTISINYHGCRTNFIGVSLVRQIRDDHWCSANWKAAWPILEAIKAWRRSGSNDCGNIVDVYMHVTSAEMLGTRAQQTLSFQSVGVSTEFFDYTRKLHRPEPVSVNASTRFPCNFGRNVQ